MASATRPTTFGSLTALAAATSTAPSAPIPDNCHTIILVNKSTTTGEDILYGIGTPGVTLVEGTTGERLAAGDKITLGIGTIRERGVMDNGTLAGSGYVYTSLSGTPNVGIIYLNLTGGTDL